MSTSRLSRTFMTCPSLCFIHAIHIFLWIIYKVRAHAVRFNYSPASAISHFTGRVCRGVDKHFHRFILLSHRWTVHTYSSKMRGEAARFSIRLLRRDKPGSLRGPLRRLSADLWDLFSRMNRLITAELLAFPRNPKAVCVPRNICWGDTRNVARDGKQKREHWQRFETARFRTATRIGYFDDYIKGRLEWDPRPGEACICMKCVSRIFKSTDITEPHIPYWATFFSFFSPNQREFTFADSLSAIHRRSSQRGSPGIV